MNQKKKIIKQRIRYSVDSLVRRIDKERNKKNIHKIKE